MNKIFIVTETGSDLSKEEINPYNIKIVPMHVTMDGENLNDGEFDPNLIFEYYHKNNKLPTTSATNPNEYLDAFMDIRQHYPDAKILHLCYSAITTSTWQNAHIASEGLDYVYHIDTKAVSAMLGTIVLKIADYIKDNPTKAIEEVIEKSNQIIDKSHMAFIPHNLDFLRAGGRVSNASYLGATLLKLRPVIEIVDGKLICTEKVRGSMNLATKKLVKNYLDKYQFEKESFFMINGHHLNNQIKEMAIDIAKSYGYEKIRWVNTGCVIATHGGPGSFGIGGILLNKKN